MAKLGVYATESSSFWPRTYLQALLVEPLLLFQSTGLTDDGLPADFSKNTVREVIPKWTVILCIICSVTIYFWCMRAMFFGLSVQSPSTTNFGLIDFAAKAAWNKGDNPLARLLNEFSVGRNDLVREKLEDKVRFLGDVRFEEGDGPGQSHRKIGFTMDDISMVRLDRTRVHG